MNRRGRRPRGRAALVALCLTLLVVLPAQATLQSTTAFWVEVPPGQVWDGAGKPEQAPAVKREAAVSLVRQRFDVPEQWGEPRVQLENRGSQMVWSLSWEVGRRSDRVWVRAAVDARSGWVTEYYRHAGGHGEDRLPLWTGSEAEAMAREWLDRLVPQELRQDLRPGPATQAQKIRQSRMNYTFRWQREALGYPVLDQGATVGINAATGELQSFALTWNAAATFTLPEGEISREEAERLFLAGLPMGLRYHPVRPVDKAPEEYRILYDPFGMTGPLYLTQGREWIDLSGAPLPDEQPGWRLVPPPDTPYQPPADPPDEAAAVALARELTGRTDPPAVSMGHMAGPGGESSFWGVTWPGAGGSYQEVMIDQQTLLVTGLTNWPAPQGSEEGTEWKLTVEEAREKATAFLRTYRPDLAGRLAIQTAPAALKLGGDSEGPVYPILLAEMWNGVMIDSTQGSVEVDMRTGEIRSFWFFQAERTAPLPEPVGLMAPERARAHLLETLGLQLGWQTFPPYPWAEGTESRLVWALGGGMAVVGVDAKNGAVLDWGGHDLRQAVLPPTDIAGHYAEREIELLWAAGVLESRDGRFEPDLLVSAGEAIRWLVRATADEPEGDPLQAAVAEGILLAEELNGVDLDGPVTREQFALWAVRVMGHGRIAQMEVRIPVPFADAGQVGERYGNAVAILAGLSIVSGDSGGRFHPQGYLTRGAAARITYGAAAEQAER
ncbi:MAG: YcdB/YcdC domain-containing protein [Bacillota bacterium]